MSPANTLPWGLVLVRVATGAIVAARGWSGVGDGADPTCIENAAGAIERAPAIYRWFGELVVLANPLFSAHVAIWGQLVLGSLLLLGALVRPAGTLLALLMLNACFAGPEELRPFYLLLGLCAAACVGASAGRRAGLDASLDESLPSWLTWTSHRRRRPF